MNLANEGLEAKRQEDEALAKKRKAEEEKVWEGTFAGSQLSSLSPNPRYHVG